MKTLIIYHSVYKNNTEKIAQQFADKIDCDLIKVSDLKNVNLDNYNLIGFGSGVYKESLSPQIFKAAERLNLVGKNVFVFSTSGVGLKFYNNHLIKQLQLKGATVKGSFACKGSFVAREFTDKKIFNLMGRISEGHPNEKDFKRAEKFIINLMASL